MRVLVYRPKSIILLFCRGRQFRHIRGNSENCHREWSRFHTSGRRFVPWCQSNTRSAHTVCTRHDLSIQRTYRNEDTNKSDSVASICYGNTRSAISKSISRFSAINRGISSTAAMKLSTIPTRTLTSHIQCFRSMETMTIRPARPASVHWTCWQRVASSTTLAVQTMPPKSNSIQY